VLGGDIRKNMGYDGGGRGDNRESGRVVVRGHIRSNMLCFL